jgi:membrane protein implicated in regulation of membrane protease activity
VGLFRPPRGFAAGDDSATSESTSADTKAASDTEWQNLLPGRLKKAYRIIKAAPLVVLLAGVIALGAALLTLDGFLSAIGRFADILIPHTRSIIICAAVSIAVLVLGVLLLNYRTRKLIAEYEYRREVLEKTGIIIIDKGTRALSADPSGDVPYVLVSGESLGETKPKALPATDEKPEQPQT